MIHLLPTSEQTEGGIVIPETERTPTNWGFVVAVAPDAQSEDGKVDWCDYENYFVAIQDNEGVPHRLGPSITDPVVTVAHHSSVINLMGLDEAIERGMFPSPDEDS